VGQGVVRLRTGGGGARESGVDEWLGSARQLRSDSETEAPGRVGCGIGPGLVGRDIRPRATRNSNIWAVFTVCERKRKFGVLRL
jgi:hypothetical protein